MAVRVVCGRALEGGAVKKAGRVGAEALTPEAVALVVKRHAERANFRPEEFAGHTVGPGLLLPAPRRYARRGGAALKLVRRRENGIPSFGPLTDWAANRRILLAKSAGRLVAAILAGHSESDGVGMIFPSHSTTAHMPPSHVRFVKQWTRPLDLPFAVLGLPDLMRGVGGGAERTTVDQALIRGLATA